MPIHAHDHHDDHAHGHGHDHGHGHGHGAHGQNEQRLFWTSLLTAAFMIAEIVGGLFSGSLALLADAGHMFADLAGLILAWLAFRMSRWPADSRRTYGFDRMQILVAFGNGVLLIVVAAMIVGEAAHRVFAPSDVVAMPMLVVAGGGLLANLAVFAILHGSAEKNLNMRGAIVHVIGDLLGSVGAIVAAVLILTLGWTVADPIVSAIVAVLILRSAVKIVLDSAHILLEGAPTGIAIAEIGPDLVAHVPDVAEVHHVHAWSLTEDHPMVTLHACIRPGVDADVAVRAIKGRLRQRFAIDHATVEIERDECADGAAGKHHQVRARAHG